jgi:DNA-binding MarR family transcriptional regulator
MSQTAAARIPRSADCTCLRLRKATRKVSQIYDGFLAPYGLTITQYSLLGHLRAFDGIGLGALAERLITDPTTLTRNLKPLERRGLVMLAPDLNDRRARRLHLTEAGRAAFFAAKAGWTEAQRKIEATLGVGDAAALNASLDRVLDLLHA